METATITNRGEYKRLVEPKFNVSNETIGILDDLVKDEEQAIRMKTYIIEILLKLRERDQSQGYSGNDADILLYFLDQLIDQIMLDKGLKLLDTGK